MSGAQERTEEATPRRRARAAVQGNGATSPVAIAVLSLALAALPVSAGVAAARGWPGQYRWIAERAVLAAGDPSATFEAVLSSGRPAFAIIAAAGAEALGAAVLSALLCGSLGFAPQAAMPRPNRFSPAANAKRLLSAGGVASSAVAIPLVATTLFAAIAASKPLLLASALNASIARHAALLFNATRLFWSHAVASAVVIAGIEVVIARRRFVASLRMTQQEVRDERREHEGNPELRTRRRALWARRARGFRLRAIARATAVIANPTHVAVALRYAPPEIDVPQIVSRGAELAAAAIRSTAHFFGVPVIESQDLARALYERAEIDDPIPVECYAAVAAIFALLIRTRGELRGQAEAQ